MSYQNLRQTFTGFFEKKGHLIVPSSSLVPAEDPSLLFTNAGMNQFKDMFLGTEKPVSPRVVSVQRCARAGGKHNDLENVGYTARHHTFFEMLGNFSFGDYFKEQAIEWAYHFVTEVLHISKDKLWFTIHHSDDESFKIWTQHIGVPASRVVRKGDKDNFWAMGDVGPCGPCTEIFYDHGPSVAGGPPGSADEDGDRYMEIWNLVFMQYQRFRDGTLEPLPQPCVDTGMGLERLACVTEGVFSNFDISLFRDLKKELRSLTPQADEQSLNVIADHLRASVFILTDGVTPTADGRGYVLRRLIRRALRHAYQLGIKKPFLQDFVPALTALMGQAYPEIVKLQAFCQQRLLQEQELFFHTLQSGQKYFEQELQKQPGQISGETLFKLYDTYGFPLDIAIDEAKRRHIHCDLSGYEKCMQQQKELSRGSCETLEVEPALLPETKSVFVRDTSNLMSIITGVYESGPQKCWLCFDKTIFYAESGGQLADHGSIFVNGASYDIIDAQKFFDHMMVQVAAPASCFEKGAPVQQILDGHRRQNLCVHHTATHLLHAAIGEILGKESFQKGSLVAPDRLRFDIACDKALTLEQMTRIEAFCQKAINDAHPVVTKEMSKEEALSLGAMAFFEDKYGEVVRVVHIGDKLSLELCGGTHVKNLSEIKAFVLLSDELLSAGVRRLSAICGNPALDYLKNQHSLVQKIEKQLKVAAPALLETVATLQQHVVELQKQQKQERQRWVTLQAELAGAHKASAHSVLTLSLEESYWEHARYAGDVWKVKLPQTAVGMIAQSHDQQCRFLLVVAQDSALDLAALLNVLKEQWPSIKGGGRNPMIQAGGTGFSQTELEHAIVSWLKSQGV